MADVTQHATWSKELDVIKERLDELERSNDSDSEESEDRNKEPESAILARILQDACNIVRRAQSANREDLAEVVEKVGEVVNRGINIAYGSDTVEIDFIPSFAHEDSTLVRDPIKHQLGQGVMDLFAKFAVKWGDPEKLKDLKFFGPGPWKKHLQPNEKTTPLSRFRRNVIIPPADTHPLANIVFEARCEVTHDNTCSPIRLAQSADGACLAMTGAGGYKNRDPYVQYWLTGRADEDSSFYLHDKTLETGLGDIARHVVCDDARKLVFAADDDRVKSFSWDHKGRAVHTMNSTAHSGPLALLPGGRLVRAGKGSALVWNLDTLETHGEGKKKKRIGEGKYTLEDSWRDCDSVDAVEPSTGSPAHTTLKFADSEISVGAWRFHQPTSHMLCGEDSQANRGYRAFAMDLERGAIVTRFLGHGGDVTEFSTSEGDPHAFATSATDGYARVYDVRHPLPVLTFDVEQSLGSCETVAFAHLDGIPVLFTGGTRSENVKFWDVRAKKLVYELATGNNTVNSMVWDATHSALYAATECSYIDRIGRHHQYRRFRKPNYTDMADVDSEVDEPSDRNHRAEPAPAPETGNKRKRQAGDEEGDKDGDENAEGDEDDSDDVYDEKCWPSRAFHGENYFGYSFDTGDHAVFCYKFKADPNLDLRPAHGSARLDRDDFW